MTVLHPTAQNATVRTVEQEMRTYLTECINLTVSECQFPHKIVRYPCTGLVFTPTWKALYPIAQDVNVRMVWQVIGTTPPQGIQPHLRRTGVYCT